MLFDTFPKTVSAQRGEPLACIFGPQESKMVVVLLFKHLRDGEGMRREPVYLGISFFGQQAGWQRQDT